MEVVVSVEHNMSRWSLGKGPEWRALLGLGIKRIHVQQLSDVVVKVLFELETGILYAFVKTSRSFLEDLNTFFESNRILLRHRIKVIAFFQDLHRALGSLSEQLAEHVSGPLHAMKSLLREHL